MADSSREPRSDVTPASTAGSEAEPSVTDADKADSSTEDAAQTTTTVDEQSITSGSAQHTSPSSSPPGRRDHPYSPAPYHNPYQTGEAWGLGHSNIGNPTNVEDAHMISAFRYQDTQFARVTKLYSGPGLLLLCISTVLFTNLMRWIWRASQGEYRDMREELRLRRRRSNETLVERTLVVDKGAWGPPTNSMGHRAA